MSEEMTERKAKRSQYPGWLFLFLSQIGLVYSTYYRAWVGVGAFMVASLAVAYGLRITGMTEGICWAGELRDGKPREAK